MIVSQLLALAFTLAWVPMFVFRVESLRASLPSYAGSERRWVILTPAVISIHVTAACVVVSGMPTPAPWAVAAAMVILASADGLWLWGRSAIGPLHDRRLPDEPPLRLRRDGPFGLVRHPLYASYLLACAAPLPVARHAPLLLTFACCAVTLAVRARLEERRLHALLGQQYAAYCREVKRLLPFVW